MRPWRPPRGPWLLAASLALTPALCPGQAVTAPAHARQGTVVRSGVAGVVVASDDRPLAGARVACGAAAGLTGPEGRFALPSASPPCALAVSAPGFTPVSRKVSGGGVRIVLQPAALAETVTVAATARNQPVTSVPVLAQVMSARRAQTSAASNLDGILRQFPALATYRRSSSLNSHPTTQGVSLLGTGTSGASRALVLVDGLPLNDPYGGWVDWLRVPDLAIADLTVVEGGASPLYGNNALSGVIAVATRPPTRTQSTVQLAGGNLDSGLTESFSSFVHGHWAGGLGQNWFHTAGYVPIAPAQAGAVDTPAGVNANDLSPEAQWIPGARAMFTLGGEYFGEERGNGTLLEQNSTALRRLYLRGAGEAAGNWQGSLFGESEDFASSFTSVAADRNSETLVLDQRVPSWTQGGALDWSADQASPLGPLHWVFGGSWMRVSAVDSELAPLAPKPQRSNDGRQLLDGGFAEVEAAPNRRLSLLASLRLDHWRDYDAFALLNGAVTPFPDRSGRAVSPGGGLVWRVAGPLSLRASAYESFRAPTLNELYRPFRVGNTQTLANPALAPERYRGWQAGADWSLGRRGLLRATYFDGQVVNAITNVTLSTTPQLITQQRQNVDRLRPRGEEFDSRLSLAPGLSLWAGYAHLHSIVTAASTPDLVGLAVAHVPQNSASLRLVADRDGWTLSAEERFGGAEFDNDLNTLVLPSFWNTDLYLSRDLTFPRGWTWLAAASPYIAAQNLWNRRYAVELTPSPLLSSPRLIMAGLRLQFGDER